MEYSAFLIGPHLIGLLFIILGLMQKYLPPKKINNWYGYRTATARSSQQLWDEGNRYSANYMIRAGQLVLIFGFILYAGSLYIHAPADVQKIVNYGILFGGAVGIGIFSTIATEKHLKEKIKNTPTKKRK